jgi:U3 small nucleolar ribonucleoprotein protein LCP5
MKYSRNKKYQQEEESEEIESMDEQSENEDEEIESQEDQDEQSQSQEDSDSEAEIYKNNDEEETKKNSTNENDDFIPTQENKDEFVSLLKNIRSNIDEVSKKMNSVLTNFSQPDKAEIKYGISYLDSKNNFLLIYLTDLILYSLLKSSGKLISNHPIIKRMIYVKTVLEKTKVIDLKLKTQIDRLLKLGEKSLEEIKQTEDLDETALRPRILDDEEEEPESDREEIKKKAKYKVQRDFQEFFETSTDNKQRKKQIEKMREKVRNSEMYKEIREQFNDNPTEINNYDSQYNKFMKEVEDYEEDHFTRVKVPKRELKKLKKLDRKDNDFSDMGREFKNLENLLNQDTKENYDNEVKFLSKKRAVDDIMKEKGSSSRGGPRGGSRGGFRGSRGGNGFRGRGNSFRGGNRGRGRGRGRN